MGRTPTDDEKELLASISEDWLREGLSTEPADREKTQWRRGPHSGR